MTKVFIGFIQFAVHLLAILLFIVGGRIRFDNLIAMFEPGMFSNQEQALLPLYELSSCEIVHMSRSASVLDEDFGRHTIVFSVAPTRIRVIDEARRYRADSLAIRRLSWVESGRIERFAIVGLE
jgi:hypothetical protein